MPVALLIIGLATALAVVVALSRPRFQATALLGFPQLRSTETALAGIDLITYRRLIAGSMSTGRLVGFLEQRGVAGSDGAAELLSNAQVRSFWETVATPIPAITREDRRQFGLTSGATASDVAVELIGVRLFVPARTESSAREMITILGDYIVNALLWERIHAWVIERRAEAEGLNNLTRAEILRAEQQIAARKRMLEAMMAVVKRYPATERMDERLAINLSSGDRAEPESRGERLLSPMTQIVASESAIVLHSEEILEKRRKILVREGLVNFFADAQRLVESNIDARKVISGLRELTQHRFGQPDTANDRSEESRLAIAGPLDVFSATVSKFSLRGQVNVVRAADGSPVTLGVASAGASLVSLAAFGLWRRRRVRTES